VEKSVGGLAAAKERLTMIEIDPEKWEGEGKKKKINWNFKKQTKKQRKKEKNSIQCGP